jgi:hypothetical protein
MSSIIAALEKDLNDFCLIFINYITISLFLMNTQKKLRVRPPWWQAKPYLSPVAPPSCPGVAPF